MGIRARLGVLAIPAAVLLAGWITGVFDSAPPIYDGIALPVEPYRYLQPPPGLATTAPPSAASETISLPEAAGAQTVELTTSENPPQATVIFSTGAFDAPVGERIVVRVAPVPPPVRPRRGDIDGNDYEVTATGPGPGGPLTDLRLRPGQVVTVALRATGAPGRPTLDHLDRGVWRSLATTQVPGAEYSVSTGLLGQFSLVIPPGSAGGGGGSGVITGAVAGGAILLLAGILVIRVRGRGAQR